MEEGSVPNGTANGTALIGVQVLNGTLNGTLRVGNHTQHEPTQEEITHALIIFYLVMFSMFAAQTALVVWRKRHRRSYELVTLVGLLLIPPIIAARLGNWLFLAAWAAYTGVTGYFIYNCSFGKMDKALPKKIYSWFLTVFKVSVGVGALGYALLLMEVFGIGPLLRPILDPSVSFIALWYGLYFGILARDSAEIASDRIAVALGGRRQMAVSVRDCGICGTALDDGGFTSAMVGAGGSSSGAAAVPVAGPAAEGGPWRAGSVQLSCKHLFHEECIRGWTIVGKKDTCPTCWEKVDLRELYSVRPWETTNLSWIQMLDMVRYLVVWVPVILTALHFFFHLMGMDVDEGEGGQGVLGLEGNLTVGNSTAGALNLTASM